MKLLPLLAAALVLGAGLAALVPSASAAITYCTSAANKLPGPDCQHTFCLAPQYYYGREYCRLSEEDIPDCGPGCLWLP